MSSPIEIKTPRLKLRQWRLSDHSAFASINADSRVMEFFPKTLTQLESDFLAQRLTSRIAEHGWGFWALERLDSGVFIGFVGLGIPELVFHFSPCVEIGWRLAFQHWGAGLATEAATAALKFGFEKLNLPEIVAFASIHNYRSRAVMNRIGMSEDPETFQHPALESGSYLSTHCLYRLNKCQWVQNLK